MLHIGSWQNFDDHNTVKIIANHNIPQLRDNQNVQNIMIWQGYASIQQNSMKLSLFRNATNYFVLII